MTCRGFFSCCFLFCFYFYRKTDAAFKPDPRTLWLSQLFSTPSTHTHSMFRPFSFILEPLNDRMWFFFFITVRFQVIKTYCGKRCLFWARVTWLITVVGWFLALAGSNRVACVATGGHWYWKATRLQLEKTHANQLRGCNSKVAWAKTILNSA